MKIIFCCSLFNFFLLTLAFPTPFTSLKLQTTSYIIYPNYSSFSGGMTTISNQGNYKMVTTCGTHSSTIKNSSYFTYKATIGFISYFIKGTIFGVKVEFSDFEPNENEVQKISNIDCKITITSYTGIKISTNTNSIQYRISNNGPLEENFTNWVSSDIIIERFSDYSVRVKVTIPNSLGFYFTETNNNYIQWYYRDEAGNQIYSQKYNIKIIPNDEPKIILLQPRELDIVSINPVIEVITKDEYWGINPSSITIKIEDEKNNLVFSLENKPEIFNEQENKIYYKIKEKNFPSGKYKLTITVADKNNKISSKSVNFYVKLGEIVDVVPYPSPFDPRKETLKLRYTLKEDSWVSINLYNQAGTLVKNLINNEFRTSGINEEVWYGKNFADENLANDVYFCEIIAKNSNGENRYYTSVVIFRRK